MIVSATSGAATDVLALGTEQLGTTDIARLWNGLLASR
jgi:hypothetical protein